MRYFFLLFLSSVAFTSGVSAQVSFGPEIGAAGAGYIMKANGSYDNTQLKGSIRIGGNVDIGLRGHFHLQPGIFYVNNGVFPPAMAGGASASMKINTILVPVHLIYKINSGYVTTPFFGVGPYLGINAGGRVTTGGDFTYPNPPAPFVTRSLAIGAASGDNIKRFDAGLSTTAGIQLANGLYVSILFQRGFVNLQPGGNTDNNMKNYNFAINCGYFFHCHHAAKAAEQKK